MAKDLFEELKDFIIDVNDPENPLNQLTNEEVEEELIKYVEKAMEMAHKEPAKVDMAQNIMDKANKALEELQTEGYFPKKTAEELQKDRAQEKLMADISKNIAEADFSKIPKGPAPKGLEIIQ